MYKKPLSTDKAFAKCITTIDFTKLHAALLGKTLRNTSVDYFTLSSEISEIRAG